MNTPLKYESWGFVNTVYFYKKSEGPLLDLGLICTNEGYPEPYCDITIRVPDSVDCAENTAFVKDYSENEGIGKWLIENGIAYPTGKSVQSGFVTIEEYIFDLKKVEEHMYSGGAK